MTAENPLLDLLDTKDGLPFDRIGSEHVEPGLRTLLADAKARIEAISKATEPPDWDGVYGALEAATRPLEVAYGVVGHLESVKTTPELRAAYNAVKPDVSAFFATIPLDEGLFARLTQLAEAMGLEGVASDAPSSGRARALTLTLDDFRRHGAALPSADKQRLEALSRELAAYTAKFGQNVVDATSAWSLLVTDERRLAGLPESAKRAARAAAEQRRAQAGAEGGSESEGEGAGWLFTLHAPSMIPALMYLEDAGLREEIYRAYYARASEPPIDNGELITKILEVRERQARLLGYESFADLVLEPRMARTSEQARRFVRDLTERCRPAFEREKAELAAFHREVAGDDAPPLRPWDVGYYAERMRRARFDFDEEALRPYFEVTRVVQGLFEVAERLYGVRIEPDDRLPGWHPDVRAFTVRDGAETLGSFYVDLYPREDKRGGAWMHGLVSGVLTETGSLDRAHLGLFAANITPPIEGAPALLTHDEVQTLFHEFGHLLHHLLSRVHLHGQAGTRVAWDFVELPSQIMENWCWSREALDLFARHHETGAPIPDDLFEKMQRTRTFRAATAMMRQLGFAEVDLALHLDFDLTAGESPTVFARRILERFAPVEYYDGWAFLNGFSHLFASATGYAAGYYSYKWAEVLDADAFTRFLAAGVFDPEIGRAFRREILEKGDSEAPEVLFSRFMGREPRIDALLERNGLLRAA